MRQLDACGDHNGTRCQAYTPSFITRPDRIGRGFCVDFHLHSPSKSLHVIDLQEMNQRSYWIPGSFETSSSMSAPSNALPRFRTLCTNSKNPRWSGSFSWEMP